MISVKTTTRVSSSRFSYDFESTGITCMEVYVTALNIHLYYTSVDVLKRLHGCRYKASSLYLLISVVICIAHINMLNFTIIRKERVRTTMISGEDHNLLIITKYDVLSMNSLLFTD